MSAFVWMTLLSSSAVAQLVPTRLYYGIHRRAPMEVRAPEGFRGDSAVVFYAGVGGEEIDRADVAVGLVDLASVAPWLWTTESPRVWVAQLELDGEEVGPPIVLQPMLTPNTAVNVAPEDPTRVVIGPGEPAFEEDRLRTRATIDPRVSPVREVTYSGIRAYPERLLELDTSEGRLVFRLRPDSAPNTAFRVLGLADGGLYTDVQVHRVVNRLPSGAPFLIQFGDPTGTGRGGVGEFADLEKSTLEHRFGTLSMARLDDPNSNGSQLFIALSREGTAFLDGRYTCFGELVEGADVVRRIAGVRTSEGGRPIDPPMVRAARTLSAPPNSLRPGAISEEAPEEPER